MLHAVVENWFWLEKTLLFYYLLFAGFKRTLIAFDVEALFHRTVDAANLTPNYTSRDVFFVATNKSCVNQKMLEAKSWQSIGLQTIKGQKS